jgi:ParB/RepB/Spo0J family partition protein
MKKQIIETVANKTTDDAARMLAAKNGAAAKPAPVILPPSDRATTRARYWEAAKAGQLAKIPSGDLLIEGNVRQVVDTESKSFKDLVDSIREEGLHQPLLVAFKPIGNTDFKLIVICGQRRKLALDLLGIRAIPCNLRLYTTRADAVSWGLAENLHREDLHFLDIGEAYYDLQEAGLSGKQIEARWAEITGHKETMISRAITAAKFPPEVKELIRAHPNVFKISVVCNVFAANRRSTYKDDKVLLQAIKDRITSKPQEIDQQETNRAGKRIEEAFGQSLRHVRGKLKGTSSEGKLSFTWKTDQEFQSLITALQSSRKSA